MPSSIFTLALAAVGVGILLCLGACTTDPPWTLNQSPDQITLRWYPDATPDSTANSVAQSHCGSWGKSAELVSSTQDGSAQIGYYRCR